MAGTVCRRLIRRSSRANRREAAARISMSGITEWNAYSTPLALMIRTLDEPGALHALTRVILDHQANITYVDIAERREEDSTIYFELEDILNGATADTLIGDLKALPIVREVERAPSF